MNLSEENLYKKVKSDLCRKIFEGIYQDGDLIPPERKLSEELGVSRVTTRKALKLLEEERIISRVQGSGTRVTMHYGARPGNMEIITLVASAQNEFFSRFLDAFQTEADKQDALVLYKQKPHRISLEKCLYQIYEKGIRNVVLWPENIQVEEETFRLLRGLGMNLVLFDAVAGGKYADAVCLDNKDALTGIYRKLEQAGCKKIGYVGWDKNGIGSLRVRENTFQKLKPDGHIEYISYEYHNRLNDLSDQMIRRTLEAMKDCDGILYAVGELGVKFENYARLKGISHKAGMIGVMPGAEELGIYMVAQDFTGMAKQIFRCLQMQNQVEDIWEAADYFVKGHQQF